MAVFNMRLNPNVGVSKALGFNPKGVVVDNVTPYWLYFPQADQYCPPFTMGWTAPLILNSNGYGYMAIQTPFGRTVQTNITPNVTHYVNISWTDDDVTYQPGTPGDSGASVDPTTDVSTNVYEILSYSQTAIVSVQTGYSLNPITNFSAIAAHRFRLLTVETFLMPFAGYPPLNFDGSLQYELVAQDPAAILPDKWMASGRLNYDHPESNHLYPNGNDTPVGYEIRFSVFGTFTTIPMHLHILYQIMQ